MRISQDLIAFTQSAFSVKKRPEFAALCLALMMLPGSNYYLSLQLTPQEPFLRTIPSDLFSPASAPVLDPQITPPTIFAKSAVVIDADSAAVLYAKNPDERLLPASTTKVMTALVALQHYALDETITVKRADRAIGQTMNLVPGEQLTVNDLLYGLLLESGNDAAFALAENFPGGYSAFVDEMNQLASKLHLTNTQFRNVSGVEQEGHFTSVRDLARLAAYAMKNTTFSQIVATENAQVTDLEGTITHRLTNKNELLGAVEGIRGVKTGWTEHAGECLVTDTVRNGHEVIAVLLGSTDRFGESKALIEWAFDAHTWIEP
jgi:serine-type D-Ala-D-Ala carboxypeptidase (penicillin-binding protein 5/6)